MIKETEHFILTQLDGKDAGGNDVICNITDGAKILIKNADGTSEPFLYIDYFLSTQAFYLRIPGSKLQDYITSWELFVELVRLLDEAYYKITYAHVMKNFTESLN